MQYFLGLREFQPKSLFDPSLMVHFRKRFPAESIAKVNEELFRRMHESNDDDDDDGNGNTRKDKTDVAPNNSEELQEVKHKGKLIVDATCAPSDIRYPQDLSLLNECRENTEQIIDELWPHTERNGHKTSYSRKKAHKAYIAVAKQRSPRCNSMRKAIGQQLEYVKKNLESIDAILKEVGEEELSARRVERLETIRKVYNQQKQMHDSKTHRCSDRIINLRQPFVRTIVRGKAGKKYEFGQKLEFSVVDGFTFIERQEWNAYNESTGLKETIKHYYERFGVYPEAVLVDQIYRTKDNRKYCKKLSIRISGPRLGRPKKDDCEVNDKQAYKDSCERNTVESKNGISKRRYGLDLIMAYLQVTAETEAALNVLAMNMAHCLRRLLRTFFVTLLRHWKSLSRNYQPVLFALFS